MDADRFDRITRLISARRSRRGFAAMVAAALLATLRAADAGACEPQCAGKACGSDGCGGSCGDCPVDSACIDDLGVCVIDPPTCSTVGGACSATTRCCELLNCVDGMCTLPTCVPDGAPCGLGADCCQGSACIADVCLKSAATCAPTGASCASEDCCERSDTCVIANDGSHTCTPAPPLTPPCAHAGERPTRKKADCCTRLHLENGRCVVNRWGRCSRQRAGRRAPCEEGSQCRGGKGGRKGVPVCVPK